MPILTLDPVININVNLAPRAVVRNKFNTGLILGQTTVFDDRTKSFTGLQEMLTAGFKEDSPEYKAARHYFAQDTGPGAVVIGNKEDGESFQKALSECRTGDYNWYGVIPLGLDDPDEAKELAALVESLAPFTIMGLTSNDKEYGAKIKSRRTLVQISTDPYAVAGVMGWAMGANTGNAGGAYTLDGKNIASVKTDDFSESEVTAIKQAYGNVYVNRALSYDVFEEGQMSDGTWFDEVVNLDMMVSDMQTNAMNLKTSVNKLAQTEGGMLQIKLALVEAMEKAKSWGSIAGGIWNGPPILNLQTGDAIPNGYIIQWEPVNEQPQADREERKSPTIYVAAKLGGANHKIGVQLDVNR